MDSNLSAGKEVNSALVVTSLEATTPHILSRKQPSTLPPTATPVSEIDQAVADRFGQFFLRMCLWADAAVTWSRRNRLGSLNGTRSTSGARSLVLKSIAPTTSEAGSPLHRRSRRRLFGRS